MQNIAQVQEQIAPPPKKQTVKQLVEQLMLDNQFDYGNILPRIDLLDALNVHPLTELEAEGMSFSELQDRIKGDALDELNAINVIRNLLLGHGKYLEKNKENYRVCLPSENLAQANRWQKQAKLKISKSMKLLIGTKTESINDRNILANQLLLLERKANIH